MNADRSIAAKFVIAMALVMTSPARACRIGWDQHLFDRSPPHDALAGAKVIHVRFFKGDVAKIDKFAVDPRDGSLSYSLIGIGRIVSKNIPNGKPFPIYAFVTSCSGLQNRPAPPGDYFLIGRFMATAGGRSFYAGGRRVGSGGQDIYGGWHF